MKSTSWAKQGTAWTVLVWLVASCPAAAQTVSILDSAQSFTILGGSTVTNTGLSVINGSIGVSPGLAITGFPPGQVMNGTLNAGNPAAVQAQADNAAAYALLSHVPSTVNLSGQDLGG
ncbi:MAG TPA: ice-binding family protein, partial [Candidatus Methylacidiphilales bacterium]